MQAAPLRHKPEQFEQHLPEEVAGTACVAALLRVTLDAALLFTEMARSEESTERRNDLLARSRAGYDAALRCYRHKPEIVDLDCHIEQRFETLLTQLQAFEAVKPPVSAAIGLAGSVETSRTGISRQLGRFPNGAAGVDPRLATLTSREIQVLTLIGEGKRTKQIAFELGITFKTVVTHRSNVMEKLNIHEGPQLVRLAIRTGLCEP